MDELLRGEFDEEAVEDEATEKTVDPQVLDRLSAYTHSGDAEPSDPPADVTDTPTEPIQDEPDDEPHVVEVVAGAEAPRRFGRRRSSDDAKPKVSAKKDKEKKEKRAKKLVGLKIGATQLAAAQVVNNGSPELVGVAREPLEQGLVVGGEIRDPDALGDALKRFFDLHKLPKRAVRLGIANNRIGVRIFEIEGVSDPLMLENAIRFRAEEVLPIPLDQAVLDYVVLEEQVREDGTEWRRILLVVAYRDVVDRYLQACRRAGIQVIGIDHEAFALLRALEAPAEREPGAGALVGITIGHDRTTIAVSSGIHCEFARVVDWGGWSLNVAIARELDRAPTEVESIKRQLSLGESGPVEGLSEEQAAKARDAAQRAIANFAREIVSSLQFYQAQPGSHGIGEVVVTGGSAHMDGLVEALAEQVGVPMRIGDPSGRVRVGSKVDLAESQGSFTVAIGLGIED